MLSLQRHASKTHDPRLLEPDPKTPSKYVQFSLEDCPHPLETEIMKHIYYSM